jgi:hypothetical protein
LLTRAIDRGRTPCVRFSSFSVVGADLRCSPAYLSPPSCSTAAAARLSFVHSHLDFKDLPARRSLLSHLVRKATVAVALLQLPLLPAGARSPPVQSDALPFGHLIWTLALHLALFCCCESLHLASEEASYVQGLISCGSGDDLSVSSLLPSPHRC